MRCPKADVDEAARRWGAKAHPTLRSLIADIAGPFVVSKKRTIEVQRGGARFRGLQIEAVACKRPPHPTLA